MTASSTRSLLLVGPGKHFGLEVARRFAVEGFGVGLIAKTRTNIDPISRALRADGYPCATAEADVTDQQQVGAAIASVTSSPGLGPLDCVIFNVRHASSGSGLETSPKDLSAALDTAVAGALAVIQGARPLLEQRPRSTVILTGGGYKDRPEPMKVSLSVSKAALHSLFGALSPSLRQRQIFLKTVVIDGVVRPSGPVFPADVADAFWTAYCVHTRRITRVPTQDRTSIEDRQQSLFLDTPLQRNVH